MTLTEVRLALCKLTGRLDLVVDYPANSADNGADFHINSAQRHLDRQVVAMNRTALEVVAVNAGDYLAQLPGVRVIESVSVTLSGSTSSLHRTDLSSLRSEYNAEPPFQSHTGVVPTHYALVNVRGSAFSAPNGQIQLALFPRPLSAVSVTVKGVFYTPALSSAVVESFWSVEHPEILLLAAAMELERFYRNTEGMADYQRALADKLLGLEHDSVEQDSAGYNLLIGNKRGF